MSNEIARVLREAADIVDVDGQWTREWFATAEPIFDVVDLDDDDMLDIDDPSAKFFCAAGAVMRVAGCDEHEGHPAVDFLRERVSEEYGALTSVAMWNDDIAKDGHAVAGALRRWADQAEGVDA